ncbi:DUF1643 domain-containing protein [[Kitasatospora] papulosa]|uniref:DUF1643 domain-containing protein n=2 Tax=Streptomyces TaxID=1883 RepID=UPI002E30D6A8|nr:DUF1643 domain-containing protein [[Kitasatospora] papulosa]
MSFLHLGYSDRKTMTASFILPEGDQRRLCAILLNPPLRRATETISHRNLLAALPLTGCTDLRLANLIDLQSKDQVHLANIVFTESDLERSRLQMAAAIDEADEVLFAWGTAKVAGTVGKRLIEQAAWVRERVNSCGFSQVWMVAGTPRHPSRWRQFVGPEKQRVVGNSFEERLAKVLAAHESGSLL